MPCMPLQPSGQFKLQQYERKRTGSDLTLNHQFVNYYRTITELGQHQIACFLELTVAHFCRLGNAITHAFLLPEGKLLLTRQCLHNILYGLTNYSPLLDEVVRSLAARIKRRAGYGEHFAVLIERKTCGDERTGFHGSLYHYRTQRH